MKNIVLTGMPASGKTTIGKLLVKKLDAYSFFDTDELIVKKTGCSICKIFEEKGEDFFRKTESEVLTEILNYDKAVISTGGGIILKEENRNLLKKASIVIYLQTDVDTLIKRAEKSNDRPLLNVEKAEEKIVSLLKQREKFYKNTSDFTITATGKTPEEIVLEILKKADVCN